MKIGAELPDSISVQSRTEVRVRGGASVFVFGAAVGHPFENRTCPLNNKQEAQGMCVAK